jgi:alpha-ketoglutarate-dependent taurine dioxygenase
LLTAAEKLYESVANSRAEREHNRREEEDDEEGSGGDHDDDKEEEKEKEMERERQQVARMLELLREAREELIAAVRIHPNDASNLLQLCSVLTLLGEMSEDTEEAEMYFEEVRTLCLCLCRTARVRASPLRAELYARTW